MIWTDLEPLPKRGATATGVSASVGVGQGRGGIPRITLSLRADVAEKLGYRTENDRFRVQAGDEPRKIRIIRDSSGRFIARRAPHGTIIFSLPLLPEIPISAPKRDCEWQVEGEAAIWVALPNWPRGTPLQSSAGAKNTSTLPLAPKPQSVARTSTPEPLPQRQNRQSVNIMGEPAPGRSALDQRRRD